MYHSIISSCYSVLSLQRTAFFIITFLFEILFLLSIISISFRVLSLPALTQANGVFSEGVLTLATTSAIQYEQLSAPSRLSELERLASDYSGKAVSVQVSAPERLHKTEAELKKEFASHPVIKSLTETFGASLIRCIPVEHTRS